MHDAKELKIRDRGSVSAVKHWFGMRVWDAGLGCWTRVWDWDSGFGCGFGLQGTDFRFWFGLRGSDSAAGFRIGFVVSYFCLHLGLGPICEFLVF